MKIATTANVLVKVKNKFEIGGPITFCEEKQQVVNAVCSRRKK